jgi:vancomycin resistance protein VanW
MQLRTLARAFVPFPLRVEIVRLRRAPSWWRERPQMALRKESLEAFPYPMAERRSPLRRADKVADERLQHGKEANVARAAQLIDGIVINAGQVFSYHHAVGRPSRLRGFKLGLELQEGEAGKGVGGGCCQVSNLLYLLALEAGLTIVERHRHGLDLFPDHGRTVPFGCGATVFYNQTDLRFQNPHDHPIALGLHLEEGFVIGRILSSRPPEHTVEIYEVDHHFEKREDGWWRENRIRRRFRNSAGETVRDEEVAHNRGRCLYDPETEVD